MTFSVKDSTEFQTLCNDLLGSQLKYYIGTDIEADYEEIPYFIAYKFNSSDAEGEAPEWIVQYVIGIEGDDRPVIESGVTTYPSTDKVEQLAVKALKVFKEDLRSGGLNGSCIIRVVGENILITEVGEAAAVQAIVTLRLEVYEIL